MRIFVAGATGVIGRRVVPLLVRAGHEVSAIARSPEKANALRRQGAIARQANLFSPAEAKAAVQGMDVVVNLATSIPAASRAILPFAWRENSRVRRVVSNNLADASISLGVKRLIQESFAPIYVDGGDRWLDERSRIKPARYNRAVLHAERAAERFSEHGGVGVVLRFAFFYGPDSEFTKLTVAMARKGRAATLGAPAGFISSISHDDASSAVVAALDVPRGIYNVADDEPLTRREFYESLARVLGAPPPRFLPPSLKYLFGSIGETLARSQRISNRKLKEASGWKLKHPSVREGWAHVIAGSRE